MWRGLSERSLGGGEGRKGAGRVGVPGVFPSVGFSGLSRRKGGVVLRAEGGGGKIQGQKAEVMEGRTCSLQE